MGLIPRNQTSTGHPTDIGCFTAEAAPTKLPCRARGIAPPGCRARSRRLQAHGEGAEGPQPRVGHARTSIRKDRPMKRGKKSSIEVQGTSIGILARPGGDFISLTDMVRNFDGGGALIGQWLKNKDTVLFLGVWER